MCTRAYFYTGTIHVRQYTLLYAMSMNAALLFMVVRLCTLPYFTSTRTVVPFFVRLYALLYFKSTRTAVQYKRIGMYCCTLGHCCNYGCRHCCTAVLHKLTGMYCCETAALRERKHCCTVLGSSARTAVLHQCTDCCDIRQYGRH